MSAACTQLARPDNCALSFGSVAKLSVMFNPIALLNVPTHLLSQVDTALSSVKTMP